MDVGEREGREEGRGRGVDMGEREGRRRGEGGEKEGRGRGEADVLVPTWTVIELCRGGRGERGKREGGREGRGRGRGREREGERGGEGGRRREKSATDEQLAVTYKG